MLGAMPARQHANDEVSAPVQPADPPLNERQFSNNTGRFARSTGFANCNPRRGSVLAARDALELLFVNGRENTFVQ